LRQLSGFATTLDRHLVISLPCVSDCVPQLTVEMTCGVQLAFERPYEFLGLAINVGLHLLHGNAHLLLDRCATTLPLGGV